MSNATKRSGFRRWRSLATSLAYFNAAWNLLLFAVNPAWGSIVLAWICLMAGGYWTGCAVVDRRRMRAARERHVWLMKPPPSVSDTPPRAVVVLGPRERVIPIPQVSGIRKPQVPTRNACSHWPRDEVKLSDGATVAYICRRCGLDWANEDWVRGAAQERQEP